MSDRERWNARHRQALARGDRRPPSAWLVEHRGLLAAQPKGAALDVACGLGRNALFLAGLGFAVDAVDVSDVAVAALAAESAAAGARVRAVAADLAREPLPGECYEVVVDVDFLARPLLPALAAALAPGGLLVFETFLPDAEVPYGPRDPAHVLRPGELAQAFPSLEVLAYRERRARRRERSKASLVARRPRPRGGAGVDCRRVRPHG